jgi:hypothetical protein
MLTTTKSSPTPGGHAREVHVRVVLPEWPMSEWSSQNCPCQSSHVPVVRVRVVHLVGVQPMGVPLSGAFLIDMHVI